MRDTLSPARPESSRRYNGTLPPAHITYQKFLTSISKALYLRLKAVDPHTRFRITPDNRPAYFAPAASLRISGVPLANGRRQA